MEETKPNNKTILIVIAFLLPLLFVLIVLLTSYFPSARLVTQYDFVYATCSKGNSPYGYNCSNFLNNKFDVFNSRIIELELSPELDSDRDSVPDVAENYRTRLFIHDTDNNHSQEITLAQAQQYHLNPLISSPDGVAVEWENARNNNFMLFFAGSSSYGYYLTKANARARLNLIADDERAYYRDDFLFLGWVIP